MLRKIDPYYTNLKRYWPIRREAFVLYVQLQSTRRLSRLLGISRHTIQDWLRSYHNDYASLVRKGTLAATGDYLRSPLAKRFPKKTEQVKEWLSQNIDTLLNAEADSPTDCFSIREENIRSRRETANYFDYRDNISN